MTRYSRERLARAHALPAGIVLQLFYYWKEANARRPMHARERFENYYPAFADYLARICDDMSGDWGSTLELERIDEELERLEDAEPFRLKQPLVQRDTFCAIVRAGRQFHGRPISSVTPYEGLAVPAFMVMFADDDPEEHLTTGPVAQLYEVEES